MLELTEKNFNTEVLKSTIPVLVDFWAPWCGPCRTLGPVIEELAKDYKNKSIKIAKLNVDEASEIASRFGIMSIPTLVFFKAGGVVEQMSGVQDKRKLQSRLDALIKS